MRRGVAYGVLAGALWGTVFVTPRVLGDFPPLLLAAGRYVMYGGVALLASLPSLRGLAARLTRRDLAALLLQALLGNFLYYICLGTAVGLVGIAPTTLIIGLLPVTVTLAGLGDHGSIPLRRLALPLLTLAAGIACINIDLFTSAAQTASVGHKLFGLACATGALACWTWYAVSNARYLRAQQRFTGHEWSTLWGIVSGLIGVLVWCGVGLQPGHALLHVVADTRWPAFWMINLGLAVGASWLGNGLWNAASRRLPLTLSGQLIVFETVFALCYGWAYDSRWPRPLEFAALVLELAGVYASVRRHGEVHAADEGHP